MQEAYPSGYGMTAVMGLEQAALEALIAQVHSRASPVYLANLNAPDGAGNRRLNAAMKRVPRGSHGAPMRSSR